MADKRQFALINVAKQVSLNLYTFALETHWSLKKIKELLNSRIVLFKFVLFVYHHIHRLFAMSLSAVGGFNPSPKNLCISTSRTQNFAFRICSLKSSSWALK